MVAMTELRRMAALARAAERVLNRRFEAANALGDPQMVSQALARAVGYAQQTLLILAGELEALPTPEPEPKSEAGTQEGVVFVSFLLRLPLPLPLPVWT